MHPNGKYAYCSVPVGSAVAVVDIEKGVVIAKAEAGKSPDGVCVSKIRVAQPTSAEAG